MSATIAFKSSPLGFSLNDKTLPVSSIFIKPKSEARLHKSTGSATSILQLENGKIDINYPTFYSSIMNNLTLELFFNNPTFAFSLLSA